MRTSSWSTVVCLLFLGCAVDQGDEETLRHDDSARSKDAAVDPRSERETLDSGSPSPKADAGALPDASVGALPDASVGALPDAGGEPAEMAVDGAAATFSAAECQACDRTKGQGALSYCDAAYPVLWTCGFVSSVLREVVDQLNENCVDTGTSAIRYCCPEDFAPECARD